jgi:hypothetical protein
MVKKRLLSNTASSDSSYIPMMISICVFIFTIVIVSVLIWYFYFKTPTYSAWKGCKSNSTTPGTETRTCVGGGYCPVSELTGFCPWNIPSGYYKIRSNGAQLAANNVLGRSFGNYCQNQTTSNVTYAGSAVATTATGLYCDVRERDVDKSGSFLFYIKNIGNDYYTIQNMNSGTESSTNNFCDPTTAFGSDSPMGCSSSSPAKYMIQYYGSGNVFSIQTNGGTYCTSLYDNYNAVNCNSASTIGPQETFIITSVPI